MSHFLTFFFALSFGKHFDKKASIKNKINIK